MSILTKDPTSLQKIVTLLGVMKELYSCLDNDNDNRNFNCATYGDVAGGWWDDGCTINDICPNCNRLDAGCTYTFMAMKRI